jgi:hypothetical protein
LTGHARPNPAHDFPPAAAGGIFVLRATPARPDHVVILRRKVASTHGEEFVIIDTPGGISDAIAEIAAHATFLVQPTSPSVDDLYRLGVPCLGTVGSFA